MSDPAAPAPPSPASNVDFPVWRAVAGASAEVLPVNSLAYYFPQGHIENCKIGDPGVLNRCCRELRRSFFLCRVLSRRFLSHPASDEAFVVYVLQPEDDATVGQVDEEEGSETDMVAATKVLTLSDANNGGGFSVPRSCAELIFPPLDFDEDPPVQKLVMRDLHNRVWEFRHIYRGTPRRHLLTTGWGKFVNAKRLIAGDSVVFMRKKSTGELLLGIRRARRRGGNNDWVYPEGCSNGFTREPTEAIGMASNGNAFEVAYYPRTGSPNFVVSAEKVADAMSLNWSGGMLIKMARGNEDSTLLSWHNGLVTGVTQPDTELWHGSPWGILQVAWGEHECEPWLNNIKRVNPWDVEYVASTSIPSHKRLKLSENPGIVNGGAGSGEIFRPVAQHMHGPLLDYPPFPAGMQGARQVEIHVPPVPEFHRDNANQTFTQLLRSEPGLVNSPALESTDILFSGNLSLGYQNDARLNNADPSNCEEQSSHVNEGSPKSFLLFGHIILVSEADEGSGNNTSNTDSEAKEVSNGREETDIPDSSMLPQRISLETTPI